jgi:hypothetical protein
LSLTALQYLTEFGFARPFEYAYPGLFEVLYDADRVAYFNGEFRMVVLLRLSLYRLSDRMPACNPRGRYTSSWRVRMGKSSAPFVSAG